jgi:hypothetical protein
MFCGQRRPLVILHIMINAERRSCDDMTQDGSLDIDPTCETSSTDDTSITSYDLYPHTNGTSASQTKRLTSHPFTAMLTHIWVIFKKNHTQIQYIHIQLNLTSYNNDDCCLVTLPFNHHCIFLLSFLHIAFSPRSRYPTLH